jgi:dimeric dUTPase (all-alpha-NTP-PPase superfamily)
MLDKRHLFVDEFFRLQDKLNEVVVANWTSKLNANHFSTAMLDEMSELMNSVTWAWWKKAKEPDMWNLKIEAIDILHFALSANMLSVGRTLETNYAQFANVEPRVSILDYQNKLDHNVFMRHMRNLLENCTVNVIDEFLQSVGLTSEEVSAIYIAKCTLNEIRQSQGYKTGVYKKIVGGVEDNQKLQSIVRTFMMNGDLDLDFVKKAVLDNFAIKVD